MIRRNGPTNRSSFTETLVLVMMAGFCNEFRYRKSLAAIAAGWPNGKALVFGEISPKIAGSNPVLVVIFVSSRTFWCHYFRLVAYEVFMILYDIRITKSSGFAVEISLENRGYVSYILPVMVFFWAQPLLSNSHRRLS